MVFGNRTLDEITNSCLFRLKQHTLPWHFDIKYLPRKCNLAADTTSRHPTQPSTYGTTNSSDALDLKERALMASIRTDNFDLLHGPLSLRKRQQTLHWALSRSILTERPTTRTGTTLYSPLFGTFANLSTHRKGSSCTTAVSSSLHHYDNGCYNTFTQPTMERQPWTNVQGPLSTGQG